MKLLFNKIFVILAQLRDEKGKKLTFFGYILFFFSPKGRKFISKFFIKILSIIIGIDIINHKKNANYQKWYTKNKITNDDIIIYKREMTNFSHTPKISIIVPTYNTPVNFLIEMIESVINQIYPNWELCIADDCSSNQETIATIKKYQQKDERIKVKFREKNGHIAESSNTALSLASGEYVALFDHDDILSIDALFHFIKLINAKPHADIIYSDEDKIDSKGRHTEPTFKMDWCPSNLLSRNYIGHLTLIRRTLLLKAGMFNSDFNGSQDYDLYLKTTRLTKHIFHIPKVLYHWRMHENSVALNAHSKPYAYIAGKKALESDIFHKSYHADIIMHEDEMLGYYSHRYKIEHQPKVSIIIPTKDQTALLQQCIDSIFKESSYTNYEIIVIDNNSTEEAFFKLCDHYKSIEPSRFYTYKFDRRFNFSSMMNFGVSKAGGEYVLLLNNDTKVITKDWIEGMLEQASLEYIGAVGVKLLFPDNTIQHAGIILNPHEIAIHPFAHKDKNEYNKYINSINNYSAVTAACLMVSKEKYWQVEGFDEGYAVEFNDVDFCLKLKEKGLHNVYIPHVELIHFESKTRGNSQKDQKSYHKYLLEREMFVKKWEKQVKNDPCFKPMMQMFYLN